MSLESTSESQKTEPGITKINRETVPCRRRGDGKRPRSNCRRPWSRHKHRARDGRTEMWDIYPAPYTVFVATWWAFSDCRFYFLLLWNIVSSYFTRVIYYVWVQTCEVGFKTKRYHFANSVTNCILFQLLFEERNMLFHLLFIRYSIGNFISCSWFKILSKRPRKVSIDSA